MTKEEIKEDLENYFNNIEEIAIKRLPFQKGHMLKTVNFGDLELIKIERNKLKELRINGKTHNLFSPEGCEISGHLAIKALIFAPNTNKEMMNSYCFKIQLNPFRVNFDFNTEKFVIKESITISYISKEDTFFC